MLNDLYLSHTTKRWFCLLHRGESLPFDAENRLRLSTYIHERTWTFRGTRCAFVAAIARTAASLRCNGMTTDAFQQQFRCRFLGRNCHHRRPINITSIPPFAEALSASDRKAPIIIHSSLNRPPTRQLRLPVSQVYTYHAYWLRVATMNACAYTVCITFALELS